MNLKNFEEYFDKTILQRGKNYYNGGAVLSIEKTFENEYTAEVEGSELYDVTVEMHDNGNIYDINCDCPYDMGQYCKHEAAVLYALRDKTISINDTSVKKSNLLQLLGKCNNTQLMEIILEHVKEDKSFGNYLCMKLSEDYDSNSIISDFNRIYDIYCKGRSDINDVLKAGKLLVDKTEKLCSSVDKVRIYAEVISILENGIENSYDYDYDEESWELYDVIGDCSACMETAVKSIVNSKNETDIASVWECILKYWHDSFCKDGEERFFPSLMQLCSFPEYRSKLDDVLVFRHMSASEYRKKEIDNQRFSIIKNYGTETEITDYINSHIDNPDFRRLAIESAINTEDYTRAEQLTLEGIASEKSRFSYVSSWHYLLHDIYKLSEDTKKLTDVCYTLVKYGKTDYYEEWKSLIPEENRSDEINRMLKESENLSYEYIISHENMSDRIYKFCCKFPDKISCYYERLKTTEFKEQSKNLYEQYIRNEGERVSNRSEYAILCKQLKKFSIECDTELAEKIAANFRELYRRKPAFMDELKKSGF